MNSYHNHIHSEIEKHKLFIQSENPNLVFSIIVILLNISVVGLRNLYNGI